MNEAEAMVNEVTVRKLVEDFKVVIQDAEALVKATAGDLSEKAREARTRLLASLESSKETFLKVEEKALAGARATDRVIRDHPYESIGVAFGIGLLIGVLINRRG
jgi:ElaB/YqjD/DUF883 family membrane-anchored ribosome-binding protein